MAIVLYSGWGRRENHKLSAKARALLKDRFDTSGRAKVAFIPADSYDTSSDYRAFRSTLNAPFPSLPMPFPKGGSARGNRFRQRLLEEFDGLFFGGGNTFELLQALRRNGIRGSSLKDFLKRGGVIMGLSAGGIVLTPHIGTASVPSRDADENSVGLRNRRGMGLLPFEFVPHYSGDRQAISEIKNYVLRYRRPVLACRDGAGIIVREGEVEIHGGATLFLSREKRYLSSGTRLSLSRLRTA